MSFRRPSGSSTASGEALVMNSPSETEPSCASFARRRSWVIEMDRSRRERREAEAAATFEPLEGLDLSLEDSTEIRPVLRLKPQRRESTGLCIACGKGPCECQQVLQAAPANDDFLSPATSDHFVLQLPDSDEEDEPNEISESGQQAFRPPMVLQPKAVVQRCHSDPVTSPTPSAATPRNEELPPTGTLSVPAPPIFSKKMDVDGVQEPIPSRITSKTHLPLQPRAFSEVSVAVPPPLLPMNTPENVRPTISIPQVEGVPVGFDMYTTPTNKAKFIPRGLPVFKPNKTPDML